MKVQFENVDFSSRSGPNGFGLKLARQFLKLGYDVGDEKPDVRLTFIQGSNTFKPNALRLDGIYFNSEQNWKSMNVPIQKSYEYADTVIVQSQFNKELTQRYFGNHPSVHVIHNGTDLELIQTISAATIGRGIPREKVWMCASSWRPHKRLADNVRLFLEMSAPDDVMLIAGKDAHQHVGILESHPRIKILGDLTWEQMIACMKASGHFVHLAWLDHCPNVVIDARASGCKIYCSSAGGTKEIAGPGATIIADPIWDYSPVELYSPPQILDFSLQTTLSLDECLGLEKIDIQYVSKAYADVLSKIRN